MKYTMSLQKAKLVPKVGKLKMCYLNATYSFKEYCIW